MSGDPGVLEAVLDGRGGADVLVEEFFACLLRNRLGRHGYRRPCATCWGEKGWSERREMEALSSPAGQTPPSCPRRKDGREISNSTDHRESGLENDG